MTWMTQMTQMTQMYWMTQMTQTTQMTGMTAWQEASQTIDRMVYFPQEFFYVAVLIITLVNNFSADAVCLHNRGTTVTP